MAIYKAKPANQFTQIPNATLQDTSLSFEAKGLLVFILSLPEDWEIHKSWLQKQTPKCGQDKLKRLLKELTDNRYMIKKAKQSEDGKLAGWDWFIYPEKQLEPAKIEASTVGVKNRPSVLPTDGKTGTTNKQVRTNKKTNKSKSVTTARARENSADESENKNSTAKFFTNDTRKMADRTWVELQAAGLCAGREKYAQLKIMEYTERFPESGSVADCFSYVMIALEHRHSLTGK